jgi:hypothetical protein
MKPKVDKKNEPLSTHDANEFEGVATLTLGGTYRMKVAFGSEPLGSIEHDERGRAKWRWNTDAFARADPLAETVNYLKALDAGLTIVEACEPEASSRDAVGAINPYDTAPAGKPRQPKSLRGNRGPKGA